MDCYRKIPWRLSPPQKARQRKRLRAVDKVVDTVSEALKRNGMPMAKAVERWYAEMPQEEEMLPRDKYTIYDRKEKNYRKAIHSEYWKIHPFSTCHFHSAELSILLLDGQTIRGPISSASYILHTYLCLYSDIGG
jgi:hypothetical protein